MANINIPFLFSFFIGSMLIGMLSTPCGAIDRYAVEFFQDNLARQLEVDRANICNICTYVCPRLFDRMQNRGLEGLYDNVDAELIPFIEPYITILVRDLSFLSLFFFF